MCTYPHIHTLDYKDKNIGLVSYCYGLEGKVVAFLWSEEVVYGLNKEKIKESKAS